MTLQKSIESYILDEGVTDNEDEARSMSIQIMRHMDFTFFWEQVDQGISEIKSTQHVENSGEGAESIMRSDRMAEQAMDED
tara:strand:- start:604 stop:846 length:243 start_codon:yes stop_codon:yes gene_type:complete